MLKRLLNMKKIVISILAIAALFAAVSCEKNLDIPQKGVVPIESFYQTDADAPRHQLRSQQP